MRLNRLKSCLVIMSAMSVLSAPFSAFAQDASEWRNAVSIMDEPKYKPDFPHFDYVNPQAPKGGTLRLSDDGTYDTFNPILAKGEVPLSVGMVFDTLLKSSEDEISTSYGLVAESLSYPADISSATFRLRPEAKWADGQPITPEDVIFSFDMVKELSPLFTNYYRHVTGAEKTGEREVTFRFDEKNNRELPIILGQFMILPKHWWEATGPDGKKRDISRVTLEPVMGSGPYKIAAFSPGSTIRYELRDDYWGKDLNVNVGQHNFSTITYTFYTDRDVEFEAFRAGKTDYRQETIASRWATGYDFPAAKDGRVVREELPNSLRATGVMQALAPNMRRPIFKDPRVREALSYVFDFEDLNRTIAFNAYKRADSYFFGTELASSGLPQGRELEILNEVKDKVPPEVFTQAFANPVGGDPQKTRDNFRRAVELFKQAGYEIRGNRMVNVSTGAPFTFEILLSSQVFERWIVPYSQALRRIGIEASVRTVDASQYTNRVRSFDFDMTWVLWAQTLNPGNEQSDYWGSSSVNRQGSKNYVGISDPGLDILINKVTFAKDREELTAATKAMDRVLLAHHYVVPLFYSSTVRLAYWNTLTHPQELPKYAIGFPDLWWSKDAAK